MYDIKRSVDAKYGNIIEIFRTEDSGLENPFFLVEQAKKEKRLWKRSGATKIRFLVDNQILSQLQMESWSRQEYRSLPKCGYCAKILSSTVYNNVISTNELFCSQVCANNDYHWKIDHMNNHEECDL